MIQTPGKTCTLAAAIEADIVERCIIPYALRWLHFCLEPTNPSSTTNWAPGTPATPGHSTAFQHIASGAREPGIFGYKYMPCYHFLVTFLYQTQLG